MPVPAAELSAMELAAVAQACRVARVAHRLHQSITDDDARQIAALAVYRARANIDTSRPDHEQRAYMARRALGDILDANARAQRHPQAFGDAPDLPDGSTPEADLAVKRAAEAISALPAPLPDIAALAVAGSSVQHMARVLHIPACRVVQLRERLARLLLRHLGVRA